MNSFIKLIYSVVSMEFGKLNFLFVILLLFFLVNCEGYTCGGGTVYDSESKQPLDSVLCKVLTADDYQQYT
ncbi:MAG: hypothetical protein K8F24_02945, partial [Bacteroidales bacterium]|nr:hypothetical protein [Bacteroidales bacterium]